MKHKNINIIVKEELPEKISGELLFSFKHIKHTKCCAVERQLSDCQSTGSPLNRTSKRKKQFIN